jgi:hypothetical protein
MVDTGDLKSPGRNGRAGSSPVSGRRRVHKVGTGDEVEEPTDTQDVVRETGRTASAER